MQLSPQHWLYLLMAIVTLSYAFSVVLEWLNLRANRSEIPASLRGWYQAERYQKAMSYQRANFGIFIGLSEIVNLPFQLYQTFGIEERFGFNKTTARTFVLDKLKGYALTIVLGSGLLTAFLWLVSVLGAGFWIWFSILAALVMTVLNLFYTAWLLPLFNRLTPLPEGELKAAIYQLAAHVQFPIDQVLVMDGSKRSAKANAFFSGWGKRKRVVLFDTLIEKHPTPELVAVLAHEVGHYKRRHLIWSYSASLIQIVAVTWLLAQVLYFAPFSLALGGQETSLALNLICFSLLFSPVSAVTGWMMTALSRKHEFEADAYAREVSDGPALVQALKRLSVDSLSNLYPHPLYVFFYYSHPPLLERLRALGDK